MGHRAAPCASAGDLGPPGGGKRLGTLDGLGGATRIFTGGLDKTTDKRLATCDAHPGRFLVAGGVADPSRPTRQVKRLRELAQHPAFSMMRVSVGTSRGSTYVASANSGSVMIVAGFEFTSTTR